MWFLSRETHHLMDRDIVNRSLTTGQKVPVITPQALQFWIFWKNRYAGHWHSLRRGWSSSQVGGSASPGLFAMPSGLSWLHFCPWKPRAKEFSGLAWCSTTCIAAVPAAQPMYRQIASGADKRFHIPQGFTACNYYIAQRKNYLAQERSEIPLGYSPREKSFPVHSGPDSALDSHCFTGKLNTHLCAFLRRSDSKFWWIRASSLTRFLLHHVSGPDSDSDSSSRAHYIPRCRTSPGSCGANSSSLRMRGNILGVRARDTKHHSVNATALDFTD